MHKWSTDYLTKFEEAFQKYLDAYMIERNIELFEDMFADGFCGYGTGLDERCYHKINGLKMFQKDLAQAPDKLNYTLHHHEIKPLDEFNAIVVAEFVFKTKIKN